MRRFVILMLLCLLPFEVLAGLAYEQELIHQAKQESSVTIGCSPQSSDDASTLSVIEADNVQNDTSLDLGESFDVVCKIVKIANQQANAPPLLVIPQRASLVLAVPRPPAI